jgi:hypothetical protein
MILKCYSGEAKTYSDEGSFVYAVYWVNFSEIRPLMALNRKSFSPSGRLARSRSGGVPGLPPLPEASARGGLIVKGRFKSRGRQKIDS